MRARTTLALVAAFLASTLAHSQSLGSDSLVTLRGLRIGAPCDSLQPALQALGAEGFQLRPREIRCATGGDFRNEVLVRWDGRVTEELHLFFTPENRLWRVKTATQWNPGPGAVMRPTEDQLIASLERRFGKPKTASGPKTSGLASAWQYQATWESVPTPGFFERPCFSADPKCPPAPTGPDVMTTASFNHADAIGPAPQLLVDMIERDVVARAEAAYAKGQERQAAEKVERDSKMLPKL